MTIEDIRERAPKNRIAGLTEADEVVQLKQLYVDKDKKEIFLLVMLHSQHSLTFVRVNYANALPAVNIN